MPMPMPMRRALGILLALVLVALGGYAASATIDRKADVEEPAAVERVERFYASGPRAEYEGDSAGMAAVEPLRWTAPGDSELSAVASGRAVTASAAAVLVAPVAVGAVADATSLRHALLAVPALLAAAAAFLALAARSRPG